MGKKAGCYPIGNGQVFGGVGVFDPVSSIKKREVSFAVTLNTSNGIEKVPFKHFTETESLQSQ